MSERARRAVVGIAVVSLIAACIDLGGPKTGIVAISNLRIPSPSVVIGDIMRDSLGDPAPLSITVFAANGDSVGSEPVTFVAIDSTVSIDADGTVHGLLRDTLGARVVAGAGTLQTTPRRIFVTVKPVSAAKDPGATPILFDAGTADSTAATNASPALSLTLSGSSLPAQGFIVSYDILRSPTAKDASAPTAYVADESSSRASRRDTTDAKGVAKRRVILRLANVNDADLFGGTKTDTIIVRATIKYLGSDVPGTPIDFIVPVSKKP